MNEDELEDGKFMQHKCPRCRRGMLLKSGYAVDCAGCHISFDIRDFNANYRKQPGDGAITGDK